MAASSGSVLVDVCMSHCSGEDKKIRDVLCVFRDLRPTMWGIKSLKTLLPVIRLINP